MKKLFISLTLTLAITSLIAGKSLAQVQLPEVTVTTTSTGAVVDQKITDAFSKSFSTASNMQWYSVDNNKRYLVNFTMDDLRNHVLYTKKGAIIYHIIYGFEKNLPMTLNSQVKGKYGAYSITSAINVKQNQRNIWMINLEDTKGYVLVRMADGQMDEMRKITKAQLELVGLAKN
ncbi:hypothetical protein [Solitalea lacus]|uniref:hypothetical protein n=1 Tax=Solitalea lacus TaxID=2911172 RepID=UPI001EDBD158|nr:hypothetical protein [Solitalea lacus]UKJ06495.1 hypothetical protein L2B55_13240 [Solitalea lacus]